MRFAATIPRLQPRSVLPVPLEDWGRRLGSRSDRLPRLEAHGGVVTLTSELRQWFRLRPAGGEAVAP